MRKLIITLTAIHFFHYSNGQHTRTLTLTQCIDTAIQNNLTILQAEVQSQVNTIQYQQSKLNRLPNLNASVGHGFNQGRSIDPFTNNYVDSRLGYGSYGLNAGMILFNGGVLSNSIAREKYNVQAAEMDWQQAKNNLIIEVILAYLTILSNQDILTQTSNQADLSLQQVYRLEKMNKEGSIPPSQLSDLQGQYAGDQLAVINAKNALEVSRLNLCRLMNISYDAGLSVAAINTDNAKDIYAESADDIFHTALKNYASVRAADFKVLSAQKDISVEKSRRWPTLRLGANLNTNYSSAASTSTLLTSTPMPSSEYVSISGNQYPVIKQSNTYSSSNIPYNRQLSGNLFSSIGLTLSIPVFNNLEQHNRIKLAKLTLRNAESSAKTTRTQLEQLIDEAYINFQTATEKRRTTDNQVQAFQISFTAAEIRFREGVGNSIDYLTAKNNLDRANINLIIARYDMILRTKILDFYQGKLLL
ncbi:TolC family protein [Polluticaenibacter yanchengensis]|uniref:TolC family protein n=1 Tax=Polluticaenibacter yanchengensis TaxID=3014562 RepID=A0ABT4UPF6_9BACT|nr:TolC family protein [Chitinophagaceae bacterium LY-5]